MGTREKGGREWVRETEKKITFNLDAGSVIKVWHFPVRAFQERHTWCSYTSLKGCEVLNDTHTHTHLSPLSQRHSVSILLDLTVNPPQWQIAIVRTAFLFSLSPSIMTTTTTTGHLLVFTAGTWNVCGELAKWQERAEKAESNVGRRSNNLWHNHYPRAFSSADPTQQPHAPSPVQMDRS